MYIYKYKKVLYFTKMYFYFVKLYFFAFLFPRKITVQGLTFQWLNSCAVKRVHSLDLSNVMEMWEDFFQRAKPKIDLKYVSRPPTKEVGKSKSKGVLVILK